MTFILPAEGSMAAHDELRRSFTAWKLSESAFDAAQTPANAQLADNCWADVMLHAINCGCELSEPSIRKWVARRLASYQTHIIGRAA